ncbi:MAG: NAD(P)-dependent oxidoreductase [Desulfobacteraceae bacterium]|nr:NAD(P)-dependent oxidoreductase [Desulfobacteraceae bacterium]
MKVLVTGAGGFIGSHLVENQLAQGHEVVALDLHLDRLGHLRGHARCTLAEGDLRDRELVARLLPGTAVVHHLASAHLQVNQPEAFFWEVNVRALENLLAAAAANGVKRFVHCSSVGVYGSLASLPADETTACRPEILYEKTKLAGEQKVLAAHRETGLPVVILRPAWVYGPRCPRTTKLFRTIKKGRFFMVGNGNNFRHPLYITDLLKAFDLAAAAEAAVGEVLVIASAEPVRLRDLTVKIARAQQASLPPIKVPLWLMRLLAGMVESTFTMGGKEPPFSSRSLKFFTDSAAFNIGKARRLLHFKPGVGLDEGLAATRDWLVTQHLL